MTISEIKISKDFRSDLFHFKNEKTEPHRNEMIQVQVAQPFSG